MNKKTIKNYKTSDLSNNIIMVIDTSLSKIVVSIAKKYALLSYKVIEYNRNYDEALICSLKDVLLKSNINFHQIDFVAVAIGPGINFIVSGLGVVSV